MKKELKIVTLLIAIGATVIGVHAYRFTPYLEISVDKVKYEVYQDQCIPHRLEMMKCDSTTSGKDLILEIPKEINLTRFNSDFSPYKDSQTGELKDMLGVIDRIGTRALSGLEFKTVNLPNTLIEIEEKAFWNCMFHSGIEIPGSVIHIGKEAFAHSGVRSVIFNEGTKFFDFGCFRESLFLESVDLPSTIVKLGGNSFDNCRNLKKIICRAVVPPVADDTDFGIFYDREYFTYSILQFEYDFSSEIRDCVLYVPRESIEAYKTASGWKWLNEGINNKIRAIEDYPDETGDVEMPVADNEDFPYTIDGNTLYVSGHPGDTLTVTDINGLCLAS